MCTCVHIRVQEVGGHDFDPPNDPAVAAKWLELAVGDQSYKYHMEIEGPYVTLLRKDSTSPA